MRSDFSKSITWNFSSRPMGFYLNFLTSVYLCKFQKPTMSFWWYIKCKNGQNTKSHNLINFVQLNLCFYFNFQRIELNWKGMYILMHFLVNYILDSTHSVAYLSLIWIIFYSQPRCFSHCTYWIFFCSWHDYLQNRTLSPHVLFLHDPIKYKCQGARYQKKINK